MNIQFDMSMKWRKVLIDKSKVDLLPEWAKGKGDSIWVNLDGYRLILIADRPPEVGSVFNTIITSHKERSKSGVGIVLREYLTLKHTVIKVIGQRTGEVNKSISQMIDGKDIPVGLRPAGGQGQPDRYGENPVTFSIKMPLEMRDRLKGAADGLDVSLNRLLVTLIEIAENGEVWDGYDVRY